MSGKNKKASSGHLVNVTNCLSEQDRLWEDSGCPNRITELFIEVIRENGFTTKDFITAVVKSVMKGNESTSTSNTFSIAREGVPDDVNQIPTMANVGVCGYQNSWHRKAFNVIIKHPPFKSWIYQVVKTIPFCFPFYSSIP